MTPPSDANNRPDHEFKGRTGARLDTLERQSIDTCTRLGSVECAATGNRVRISNLEGNVTELQECVRAIEGNVARLRNDMTEHNGAITAQVGEMRGAVKTWGAVLSLVVAIFGLILAYSTFLRHSDSASARMLPTQHTYEAPATSSSPSSPGAPGAFGGGR